MNRGLGKTATLRSLLTHVPPSDHGADPRVLLPAFSTAKPFAFYVKKCNELAPQLAELGIFSLFFYKWPPSRLLQRQVVATKLGPLIRRALEEEEAAKKEERSKTRARTRRSCEGRGSILKAVKVSRSTAAHPPAAAPEQSAKPGATSNPDDAAFGGPCAV